MLILTWVIAGLTAVMLGAVVVQLLTPIPAHADVVPLPKVFFSASATMQVIAESSP
jgi:hypothetical protein